MLYTITYMQNLIKMITKEKKKKQERLEWKLKIKQKIESRENE